MRSPLNDRHYVAFHQASCFAAGGSIRANFTGLGGLWIDRRPASDHRRRAINDPEAMTFLELLGEIKAGFRRLTPSRRSRAQA